MWSVKVIMSLKMTRVGGERETWGPTVQGQNKPVVDWPY